MGRDGGSRAGGGAARLPAVYLGAACGAIERMYPAPIEPTIRPCTGFSARDFPLLVVSLSLPLFSTRRGEVFSYKGTIVLTVYLL